MDEHCDGVVFDALRERRIKQACEERNRAIYQLEGGSN